MADNATDNNLISYKKYLTEGLLILGLTVLVYSLVYAYNYGLFLYYRIPPEFISFSIASMFNAVTVATWGILLIVFSHSAYIDIEDFKSLDSNNGLVRNMLILILFGGVSLTMLIAQGGMPGVWYTSLVIFIYFCLKYFAWPLVYYRKERTRYATKIEKYLERMLADRHTLSHLLWNFVLYRLSTFILLPIILFICVINLGYGQASHKKEYFVPNELHDYVVAQFTDGKAILIKRDDENTIGAEIKILNISESTTFSRKDIGRLNR